MKKHDVAFKARVALEAIKGDKTMAQIASEYGVHPNQIGQWKKRLLKDLPSIFSDRRTREGRESEAEKEELYRQIGQLKVELDWLKKNLNFSVKEKKALIEPGYRKIPVYRQCALLGLSRAAYYYRPRPGDRLNEVLMRLLDERYTRTPSLEGTASYASHGPNCRISQAFYEQACQGSQEVSVSAKGRRSRSA
jgi:putative transposase